MTQPVYHQPLLSAAIQLLAHRSIIRSAVRIHLAKDRIMLDLRLRVRPRRGIPRSNVEVELRSRSLSVFEAHLRKVSMNGQGVMY